MARPNLNSLKDFWNSPRPLPTTARTLGFNRADKGSGTRDKNQGGFRPTSKHEWIYWKTYL